MSFEDYERAWRAQGKEPEMSNELIHMAESLDRSRARQRRILTICSINTAAVTGLVVWISLSKQDAPWREIWPLAAFQVVACAVLAVLWTAQSRRTKDAARNASPVREAAQARMADLNSAIRRIRVLAAAAVVLLPLLATALLELYESGKMQANAVVSVSLLIAAVVVVNAVLIRRRYHDRIAPMKKRLGEILSSL